ncbi:MAG: gliding motility lipoprotein GldH [Flavobacteriaceae bacterium]|nr:gliding motility lipoprotein GldH [Flavobacteriaceae bacterium]
MLKQIILIVISILFISCTNNTIFTKYKGIENNKWHKDSIISFNYNTTDTISKNIVYINLRNDKNYAFNNLFLITTVEFPNKTKIIDTLEYEMADVKGHFLGTGFTDLKENKLVYKTNIRFPIVGEYQFSVQHAMRKISEENGIDFLNGITDVGIEIEHINK